MATRSTPTRPQCLQDCRLLQPPAVAAARAVPEPATFVIRALDLHRRAALPPGLPEPLGAEWINRGTGQRLRPTTTAMLLRTLERPAAFSPSAARLRDDAGLRLAFATQDERHRFARAWVDVLTGE